MLASRSPTSTSSSVPKEDIVEFGHLVGVEVIKGADGSQVFHKSNDLGCRWNASAASTHSLTNDHVGKPGPRGIAFAPTRLPSGGGYVIGLASAAGVRRRDLVEDQGVASLDFAIHVASRGDFLSSNSNLDVRELGSYQGTFGTFTTGDKVEVVLNEQGKVEYRVNSLVRHVSEHTPAYPLHVKLCACATGNIVRDVRWVGPSLLETAHQHIAREEHHQRKLDSVEERLHEMAAHCQAVDEHHQELHRERDALQRSQGERLVALEVRLGELAAQLLRTEEHHQEALRAAEGRLQVVTEERDAARVHSRALEEQLERHEEQRRASQGFHAEHLSSAEGRLAEHSERLRAQLDAAEERLAGHAREHAGRVVEHCHRERLDALEEQLARRLDAHRAQLTAAEELALERLHARAGEVAQEAHSGHLRTAQGELAQLHRSLANEHLGASERRLLELQRSLSAELEGGIRRQLLAAAGQARELAARPGEAAPRPEEEEGAGSAGRATPRPPLREAPEQPSGAEEALRERLRQLAAIEERMRLSASRNSPTLSPSNGLSKMPAQANGGQREHDETEHSPGSQGA